MVFLLLREEKETDAVCFLLLCRLMFGLPQLVTIY